MRLKVFGMLVAMTVATAQPFALASDEASITAGSNLSLDNIQDVAYTLQRIRQQAVNVYIEATRKKVYRYDLNVPSLASMPKTPLENQASYLPLRKGWLAFFVGTMEPLVQILNEHLKSLDERTAKVNLPSQHRAEWQAIVGDWTTAIKDLNAQLDVCANLLNDPEAGNVEVAKAATAIDNRISSLDGILHKASTFLQSKLTAAQANYLRGPI